MTKIQKIQTLPNVSDFDIRYSDFPAGGDFRQNDVLSMRKMLQV